MEALGSLPVCTLRKIIRHCGLSFADCFEKPDLVARANTALVVLNRRKAKMTLQRAARAKIASLDNYISAIDRAIRLLGYDGNLNALIPKNAGDRRYSKAK